MSETAKIIVCPYCGHVQPAGDRCGECRGLFEPLSRRATQISMGPWYVRDKMNPFRPGCSYEILKKQISSGRVKATSVIRGPTTHQFWAVARNVQGVSHLLGYCHKCTNRVSPEDRACPTCSESFREPAQRDELGLMFPTMTESAAAQRALDRELSIMQGQTPPPLTPGTTSAGWQPPKSATGGTTGDLLDEVLARVSVKAPPAAPVKSKSSGSPRSPGRKSSTQKETARVAQAVDFTPSEEGQIEAPARRGRISPAILLLIVMNIVLLFVLVLVAINQLSAPTP